MHSPATQFVLSNGLSIPAVGFGTYKTGDGDGSVLSNAIVQGYRHFDTTSFYGTEEALGQAVVESDIPREDFFLTSKLWKTEMGYDAALRAFDATLERLGTDSGPLPHPLAQTGPGAGGLGQAGPGDLACSGAAT